MIIKKTKNSLLFLFLVCLGMNTVSWSMNSTDTSELKSELKKEADSKPIVLDNMLDTEPIMVVYRQKEEEKTIYYALYRTYTNKEYFEQYPEAEDPLLESSFWAGDRPTNGLFCIKDLKAILTNDKKHVLIREKEYSISLRQINDPIRYYCRDLDSKKKIENLYCYIIQEPVTAVLDGKSNDKLHCRCIGSRGFKCDETGAGTKIEPIIRSRADDGYKKWLQKYAYIYYNIPEIIDPVFFPEEPKENYVQESSKVEHNSKFNTNYNQTNTISWWKHLCIYSAASGIIGILADRLMDKYIAPEHHPLCFLCSSVLVSGLSYQLGKDAHYLFMPTITYTLGTLCGKTYFRREEVVQKNLKHTFKWFPWSKH